MSEAASPGASRRLAPWFCALAGLVAGPIGYFWYGWSFFEDDVAGNLAVGSVFGVGAAVAAWLGGRIARRLGGRDHGWRAAALTAGLFAIGLPLGYALGLTLADLPGVAADIGNWLTMMLGLIVVVPFVALVALPAALAAGALFQLLLFLVDRVRRPA